MIQGLSHVSIAVPDLAIAARHLHEKYGLRVGTPVVNEQQGVRLAYVDLGAARIELIEPARPDSPIARFLERNPNGGIHHFCLGVDDVEGTAQTLAHQGVRLLGGGKPQHNVAGELIAFIHPGDFLGALVELEAHNGRAPREQGDLSREDQARRADRRQPADEEAGVHGRRRDPAGRKHARPNRGG